MNPSSFGSGQPGYKKTIFISHLSSEKNLAEIIARPLREAEDSARVFKSWEFQSLPPGSDWLKEIMHALDSAVVVVVLCSAASMQSPWVNFEIGASWRRSQESGAEPVSIIPLCHSGTSPGTLCRPYEDKNALQAGDEDQLKLLYRQIAHQIHATKWLERIGDLASLAAEIRSFEAEYSPRIKAVDPDEHADVYCQASSLFQHYQRRLIDERPEHQHVDRSDLWYIFLNSEEFVKARNLVQAIFEEATRSDPSEEHLNDVSMWSLLGAAELLLRFRADEEMAMKLKDRLQEALGKAPNSSSLLESTHVNPQGMWLIDVWDERVPQSVSGTSRLQSGSHIPSVPLPERSTKVFVKLHFPEGLEPREGRDITDMLGSFASTVESCSISAEMPGKAVDIVIESHYACGRFEDLQKLSRALEEVLRRRLIKETYIAYDVVLIKRGQALRDLRHPAHLPVVQQG